MAKMDSNAQREHAKRRRLCIQKLAYLLGKKTLQTFAQFYKRIIILYYYIVIITFTLRRSSSVSLPIVSIEILC